MIAHRSPLFDWADGLVDRLAEQSPIHATFAGVGGQEHRWDDCSPEGVQARRLFWQGARSELAQLGHGATGPDRLAAQVIGDFCEDQLRFIDSGGYHSDLNSISSTLQALPLAVAQAGVEQQDEARALAARLRGVPQALSAYARTLAEGAARGQAVARRQVLAGIAQCRDYSGPASPFAQRARAAAQVHPVLCPELEAGEALARAAMEDFGAWLGRDYLPLAVEADAVGAERYAEAAAFHLGMDLDLMEAHAWGVAEVLRVEGELARTCAQLGGGPLREMVAALSADPSRCAPDVERFLAMMSERQQQALSALEGRHFDVPEPIRALEVKLAPPGGPIGAFYTRPSEDLRKPGAVHYNLERQEMIPIYPEISTAHHEGFPGHHLHLATMTLQSGQLSRFQRQMAFSAGHAEGWALYAERLMLELGLLERPEYVLGMYMQELVRAWRVVVDIGLHLSLPIAPELGFHPGVRWTVERVAEALEHRAFMGPGAAASNALRYAGWPGQAIAYKIGQRVILDARRELSRRPDFDLRAFHARAVGLGAVGLGRLGALLRAPADA